MSLDVYLRGQHGHPVDISPQGELLVRQYQYSTIVPVTLDVAAQGYTLISPRDGFRPVITLISLYANKNVGAGDATVEIYEADVADSATVTTSLFAAEMPKNSNRDLAGISVLTNAGKWINAKTDDDDVFVNIGYYYLPVDGGAVL